MTRKQPSKGDRALELHEKGIAPVLIAERLGGQPGPRLSDADGSTTAAGEGCCGMMWPFGKLPQFNYGAILVDPPWRMKMYSVKGMGRSPDGPVTRGMQRQNNPERHYATMPLDEIKALPVGNLAATNCVLFMWAIDPMLPQALEVGTAWGFTFKTVAFYWAKERRVTSTRHKLHEDQDHKRFPIGTGYWTRSNPEQCLLFVCGRPKRLSAAVRKLIIEPRREHSRKPDSLKPAIQRLVAGPYLELFSRESREGWDSWGDQSGTFAQAAE